MELKRLDKTGDATVTKFIRGDEVEGYPESATESEL